MEGDLPGLAAAIEAEPDGAKPSAHAKRRRDLTFKSVGTPSPASKRAKQRDTAARLTRALTSRFERKMGSSVLRSEILGILAEFGLDPSTMLLSKTLIAVHGSEVRLGGHGCGSYKNLCVKESPSQPSAAEFEVSPAHQSPEPRVSPQGPALVPMMVTVEEACLIAAIRTEGAASALRELAKIVPDLVEAMVDATCQETSREVLRYASMPSSLLRRSEPEEMQAFSLEKLGSELNEQLPSLMKVIVQSATPKRVHINVIKTSDAAKPVITTIAGKILGLHSNRLSAQRTFYSLLCSKGGMKDSGANRLAKLHDTLPASSALIKVNGLSSCNMTAISPSVEAGKPLTIVLDNVDKFQRARHSTSTHGNTMTHMVQALAVVERVEREIGPPEVRLSQLTPQHLMPTKQDEDQLVSLLEIAVRDVWRMYLPGLSITHTKRQASRPEMAQRTQTANLGVELKDENVKSELTECLIKYQRLVPLTKKGDIKQHYLCVGDQLTFVRGMSAQAAQADGRTPTERLEGLVMVMADFHIEMNFLNLIYKRLWQVDSSCSRGTLTSAKNVINASNAGSKPTLSYYACAELFDKLGISYLVMAGLELFSLASAAEKRAVTDQEVDVAAKKLVAKFVSLSVREHADDIRCPSCANKHFTTRERLLMHWEGQHSNEILPETANSDDVFAHTSLLITLFLTRSIHCQSVKTADGDTLMLIYRYMSLMFRDMGLSNYSTGLLETVAQSKFLPRGLVTSLLWARTANTRGRADTNFPLDLHLEHENGHLKEDLKSYRGTYTESHLARISRGRFVRDGIVNANDGTLRHFTAQAKDKELSGADVNQLVELYKGADLLRKTGARTHSPKLTFLPASPVATYTVTETEKWMQGRLRLMKLRRYYKQFDPPMVPLLVPDISVLSIQDDDGVTQIVWDDE